MATFEELGIDLYPVEVMKFKSQDDLNGFLWVHQIHDIKSFIKHLHTDEETAKIMCGEYDIKRVDKKPKSVVFYGDNREFMKDIKTTNYGGLFDDFGNRMKNISVRKSGDTRHLFWRCRVEDSDNSYNSINIPVMIVRGATGEIRPSGIQYKDRNPYNVCLDNLVYGKGHNKRPVTEGGVGWITLEANNNLYHIREGDISIVSSKLGVANNEYMCKQKAQESKYNGRF